MAGDNPPTGLAAEGPPFADSAPDDRLPLVVAVRLGTPRLLHLSVARVLFGGAALVFIALDTGLRA